MEAVRKGWESGQQAAIAAVSDALLDATAVVGFPDEICARLREWIALGLDEPLLSLPQAEPESGAERLRELARAARTTA